MNEDEAAISTAKTPEDSIPPITPQHSSSLYSAIYHHSSITNVSTAGAYSGFASGRQEMIYDKLVEKALNLLVN